MVKTVLLDCETKVGARFQQVPTLILIQNGAFATRFINQRNATFIKRLFCYYEKRSCFLALMEAASTKRSVVIQRTAGGFVLDNFNRSAPKDNLLARFNAIYLKPTPFF